MYLRWLVIASFGLVAAGALGRTASLWKHRKTSWSISLNIREIHIPHPFVRIFGFRFEFEMILTMSAGKGVGVLRWKQTNKKFWIFMILFFLYIIYHNIICLKTFDDDEKTTKQTSSMGLWLFIFTCKHKLPCVTTKTYSKVLHHF